MGFSFFSFGRGAEGAGVKRLSPAAFKAQRDPEGVLIDVRTAGEFKQGHLAGARHIDISSPSFKQQIAGMDKSGTYYLYCRSGNRSGMAAEMMKSMGYENVYNIGGLNELARAGIETA